MDTREITTLLRSIDTSLQILAQAKSNRGNTVFVNRKVIAARLGVPPVTIDKLVYQGLTSQGQSGLVESRHYCKLDPQEQNISNFLFDPLQIAEDAWKSFTNYSDNESN